MNAARDGIFMVEGHLSDQQQAKSDAIHGLPETIPITDLNSATAYGA